MKYFFTVVCALFFIMTGFSQSTEKSRQLLDQVKKELTGIQGDFAFAFADIQTGEQLLWNEQETFHAASTMKTPVMIELFKQVAKGTLSLTDSVKVENEFKSIVDGSSYRLDPGDDSQEKLYTQIGTLVPLSELVYQMITQSSNLATNIIIGMLDGKKVTQTMRDLGAKNIMVLRGVEDQKAFDQHLNNTTTAYDLMLIFQKMAKGEIINAASCRGMISILLDQTHNTMIPALLPAEVKVAHKTGTITGVHHDSGIVFLPDGRKYVLVILSKNTGDAAMTENTMAKVSRLVYEYVTGSGS
jgi:beta-lactamase class A